MSQPITIKSVWMTTSVEQIKACVFCCGQASEMITLINDNPCLVQERRIKGGIWTMKIFVEDKNRSLSTTRDIASPEISWPTANSRQQFFLFCLTVFFFSKKFTLMNLASTWQIFLTTLASSKISAFSFLAVSGGVRDNPIHFCFLVSMPHNRSQVFTG